MSREGPWVDCSNPSIRFEIVRASVQRAWTWTTCYEKAQSSTSNNFTAVAEPMMHQVGGLSRHKKPMLTLESTGHILKPLRTKTDNRWVREIAFYEALHTIKDENMDANLSLSTWMPTVLGQDASDDASGKSIFQREIELLQRLSCFIPKYYGVALIYPPTYSPTTAMETSAILCNDNNSSQERIVPDSYLLLHNITSEFAKPSTIDIKMGTQSYEPNASKHKQLRECEKYPQQRNFGFRIVGMKIFDPHHSESDSNGFRTFRKDFGRSLESRKQVMNAFQMFFSFQEETNRPAFSHHYQGCQKGQSKVFVERLRTSMLANLLAKLQHLHKCFHVNKEIAFYASSILMVYEGGGKVCDTKQNESTRLNMIDFSHVCRDSLGDSGYDYGLQNLIDILNEILSGGSTEKGIAS